MLRLLCVRCCHQLAQRAVVWAGNDDDAELDDQELRDVVKTNVSLGNLVVSDRLAARLQTPPSRARASVDSSSRR